MFKVCLIFPPGVIPTYIPLGIANLKSYLEQRNPVVKVRNFDLNNSLYLSLAQSGIPSVRRQLCLSCPERNTSRECINARRILELNKKLTRGPLYNKLEDFYTPSRYNPSTGGTIGYLESWLYCINSVAKNVIEKGSPLPAVLEGILKKDALRVVKIHPGLIGFSIFCNSQISYALLLARVLKRINKAPVIFGGAYMSHIDCKALLKVFKEVDFIIKSEGEIGLEELIKNLKLKRFAGVPGLLYRKKNRILANPQKVIKDLDIIPPAAFDDFKLSEYPAPHPVIPLSFSRGCFWKKCTFCTYHKHYPYSYKVKSKKKFLDEIAFYVSKGYRYFFIVDDVISASDLEQISAGIKKRKLSIFFGAIVRTEESFTIKRLKGIYSAGGRVLIWGVESLSQRILDLMRKGTQSKNVTSILKSASRIGFHNRVFLISMFPTETQKEIIRDLKFLKNSFIHSFYVHPFVLQKDSFIFNHAARFGIQNIRPIAFYRLKYKNEAIYDDRCSFEYEAVEEDDISNKEMPAMEESIEKKISHSFLSFDYGHMLIHASFTKSKNNFCGSKKERCFS